MDRGTKLMFGMLTAAVCLMVIMMISRETPQAHAQMYQGDRGEEPTIVSFRVTPVSRSIVDKFCFNDCNNNGGNEHYDNNPTSWVLLTRMWSDGAVEMNLVGSETLAVGSMLDANDAFTGWQLVNDSIAGYRCQGDTDGNRVVNSDDVLRVIADYGNCEQDPPLNLPPDSDQ